VCAFSSTPPTTGPFRIPSEFTSCARPSIRHKPATVTSCISLHADNTITRPRRDSGRSAKPDRFFSTWATTGGSSFEFRGKERRRYCHRVGLYTSSVRWSSNWKIQRFRLLRARVRGCAADSNVRGVRITGSVCPSRYTSLTLKAFTNEGRRTVEYILGIRFEKTRVQPRISIGFTGTRGGRPERIYRYHLSKAERILPEIVVHNGGVVDRRNIIKYALEHRYRPSTPSVVGRRITSAGDPSDLVCRTRTTTTTTTTTTSTTSVYIVRN